MSVTSRSPLRVAGAAVNSGNVNTGEQNFTLGGAQNFTIYSGGMTSGAFIASTPPPAGAVVAAGSDCLIFSGAGRLKDVLIHPQGLPQNLSGVLLELYDAGAASSGGPFPLSGTRRIGSVVFVGSGATTQGAVFGNVIAFDWPFNSGLCVALKPGPVLSGGGNLAFSITFTPETNLPNPG